MLWAYFLLGDMKNWDLVLNSFWNLCYSTTDRSIACWWNYLWWASNLNISLEPHSDKLFIEFLLTFEFEFEGCALCDYNHWSWFEHVWPPVQFNRQMRHKHIILAIEWSSYYDMFLLALFLITGTRSWGSRLIRSSGAHIYEQTTQNPRATCRCGLLTTDDATLTAAITHDGLRTNYGLLRTTWKNWRATFVTETYVIDISISG